jgi:hypothetical protein
MVRKVYNDEPFKNRQDLVTDPVFLIGNGASRKDFDLERLRGIGTIIGCNALYREFTPDLLITIDTKMMREVKRAGYKGTVIIPRGRTVTVPESLIWNTKEFNTSGAYGMKLIAQKIQAKKCYMLGMDGFPGNMYDGTENYSTMTLRNFKGVVSRYQAILGESKGTTFINVNEKDGWPKECHEMSNYKFMAYEEFEEQIMV